MPLLPRGGGTTNRGEEEDAFVVPMNSVVLCVVLLFLTPVSQFSGSM
jgi:hypothetical protein